MSTLHSQTHCQAPQAYKYQSLTSNMPLVLGIGEINPYKIVSYY
jgi:hypothetical protein